MLKRRSGRRPPPTTVPPPPDRHLSSHPHTRRSPGRDAAPDRHSPRGPGPDGASVPVWNRRHAPADGAARPEESACTRPQPRDERQPTRPTTPRPPPWGSASCAPRTSHRQPMHAVAHRAGGLLRPPPVSRRRRLGRSKPPCDAAARHRSCPSTVCATAPPCTPPAPPSTTTPGPACCQPPYGRSGPYACPRITPTADPWQNAGTNSATGRGTAPSITCWPATHPPHQAVHGWWRRHAIRLRPDGPRCWSARGTRSRRRVTSASVALRLLRRRLRPPSRRTGPQRVTAGGSARLAARRLAAHRRPRHPQ